jgi:hypothetical protein
VKIYVNFRFSGAFGKERALLAAISSVAWQSSLLDRALGCFDASAAQEISISCQA